MAVGVETESVGVLFIIIILRCIVNNRIEGSNHKDHWDLALRAGRATTTATSTTTPKKPIAAGKARSLLHLPFLGLGSGTEGCLLCLDLQSDGCKEECLGIGVGTGPFAPSDLAAPAEESGTAPLLLWLDGDAEGATSGELGGCDFA